MDDNAVQRWRDRLDRDRAALADPFPAVWARVDQKRTPWVPAGLAAAAALLVGLGWGALNLPADGGWGPIVDDLWAVPGGPLERPAEAGWEIGGEEWNLFDQGADQGV